MNQTIPFSKTVPMRQIVSFETSTAHSMQSAPVKKRARPTLAKVDTLRATASLLGLGGAFLILSAAGGSDAGTLSVAQMLLQVMLGAVSLLCWRVLSERANRLSRSRQRPSHR